LARLAETLDGTIGFFWEFDRPKDMNEEPARGHLALHDDQWLVLDTLDEQPTKSFAASERENRKWPEAVLGATSEAGVMLLNQRFSGSQIRMGASRASTRHARFRTLLAGIATDEIRSPKIRGVRIEVPEGLDWSGMQAISDQHEYHKDGSSRLAKVTTTLDAGNQEVIIKPGEGVVVSLRPTWHISGPDELRTITTGLIIECTARNPREFNHLARYLDALKQLLHLCFGRDISVSAARALPHYKTEGGAWADVWDDRFMTKIDESAPPRSTKKPRYAFLGLTDLGSSAEVRRWIDFYFTHGRFVGPVLHGIRLGNSTPVQSRVLSLAAGIEYFVAFNRSRKRKWAADRHMNRALATYAGRYFKRWIGDVDAWADELQATNNAIKHDPAKEVDPVRTLLLAQTAEVLISCVALSEIAGRKGPIARYLADHRIEVLGRRFRDEFGT
jgi:hypothetical protein